MISVPIQCFTNYLFSRSLFLPYYNSQCFWQAEPRVQKEMRLLQFYSSNLTFGIETKMWDYSFFLKQAVMFGCLLKEGCSHILHTQYGFYDGMYSGVKKECDLVAQNAKNSLI